MYMKNHILAALREEFNQWEAVLAGLSEAQIIAAPQPTELPIKDEIAHLWAWQQRSIARVEAALHNRKPELPQWLPKLDPDGACHRAFPRRRRARGDRRGRRWLCPGGPGAGRLPGVERAWPTRDASRPR